MVVIMDINAPISDIEKVKEKVLAVGCKPHFIYGAAKIAIGLTGPTEGIDEEEFQLMDSVEEVLRVSKKYKLVSREVKKEDTVITFGEHSIGGKELGIIAGPCSVESKEQIFEIAGQLSEMGIKFFRAGAYKPRSSPYAFQGMKEKGLDILSEVKKVFNMYIVTEAKDSETLDAVAEVADIVQIGARNMQNYSLLERLGNIKKAILLKRGMAATIEDILMSAEYVMYNGNHNIILCERGIKTFETFTRNTLDLNAVPVIKKHSHLPIIVDPSHGIGIWDKVPAMSMAGVAAGADGLIIEVHHKPDLALSDGYQSLTPKTFKKLLEKLKQLAPIVDKEVKL
jgi:3-deoxy-7-phosphoheptulonate synthase